MLLPSEILSCGSCGGRRGRRFKIERRGGMPWWRRSDPEGMAGRSDAAMALTRWVQARLLGVRRLGTGTGAGAIGEYKNKQGGQGWR
eukprot:2575-Pleurochrysis_carterae.AAC.1